MDAVITINNPVQLHVDCIQSLLDHREGIKKIIIVNNASTDMRFIPKIAGMSDEFVTVKDQVSIGQSWNLGIAKSTAEFVLVSNDDIVFAPDWKAPLDKALAADPKIGVLQPFNTLSELPEGFPNNYKKHDMVGNIADGNFIGCCFVVRTGILPYLKLFDQDHFKDYADYTFFCDKFYPFGPEDQDFYERVRQIGYTTKTHYASYVHHYTGQTMKNIKNFEEIKAQGNKLFHERWSHGNI